MNADDGGSAAVLLLAIVGVAAIIGLLISDTGSVLSARARATAAADAAALAAAPVTFRPFGAAGTPRQEAAAFAQANGARLVACTCRVDRSFRPRDVIVEVRVDVPTLLMGTRSVPAVGRAHFDPRKLGLLAPEDLAPFSSEPVSPIPIPR